MKKKAVGGKFKCLYNKIMWRFILTLILLPFTMTAWGAQNKDHWYKVENKEADKKQKERPYYPYDSVEKDAPNKTFHNVGYWSLRPKFAIAGGFHADKALFNEGDADRLFLNANVRFRNRPWHRVIAGVQLLQNNSMFISANWEFIPSRERIRTYYGPGVAHLLKSNKELSNLVEWDSYYVTAVYGMEFLLENHHGWNLELKAFYSGNNYALQLAAGYIIPF